MDFYKLTDFQLYSIINSRHLNKGSKEQAERELSRRNLSDEKMKELRVELAEKTKSAPSFFSFSSNTWLLLLVAVMVAILMKQCVFQ